MGSLITFLADYGTYIAGYAVMFSMLVILGILQVRRQRRTARLTPAQQAHQDTLDRVSGAGANTEHTFKLVGAMFISDLIFNLTLILLGISILAIYVAVYVATGQQQLVLVGLLSLPFVVVAGYTIYRSERWWIRKAFAM